MSKDYEFLKKRVNLEVWRLTRESGIRGWNTMDLAEAVGISKRTLYKVVRSKESILLGAVVEKIQDIQHRLAAVVAQGGDTREKIERITETFPGLVLDLSPSIFQQIYRTYPAIEEEIVRLRLSLGDPVIAFLRESQASGEISSTPEPGTIFQMFQAFVLYFITEEKESMTAVAKIRQSMKALFEGLYPRQMESKYET